MPQTKEEIDAGINQYEDEQCAHLQKLGDLAAEAGVQVGGDAGIPKLNPDGSSDEDLDLEESTD